MLNVPRKVLNILVHEHVKLIGKFQDENVILVVAQVAQLQPTLWMMSWFS